MTSGGSWSPDDLIRTFIEEKPYESSDARLKGSGIPVWAIVGHWRAAGKNVSTASGDYDVPQAAIEAALAYYDRHKDEIDARIAANAA